MKSPLTSTEGTRASVDVVDDPAVGKTANSNVQPLHDYVLVKRLEPEAKSAGGLYIPDASQEKASQAVVIAVGPGRIIDAAEPNCDFNRAPMSVAPGDVVLLGRYTGLELELSSMKLVMIRDGELLATITPKKRG